MENAMAESFRPEARQCVRDLALSKVREVANAGFGSKDILKFWFGESNLSTPDYIRDAAVTALAEGRTFYTHNNGTSDLRKALATYLGDMHNRDINERRISVTSSGVSALMIAMQAILDPGDRVVVVTPVWPNVAEIPKVLNADLVRFALVPTDRGWSLDLDAFLSEITPETRLVIINSPGNPTGWTLPPEARVIILEHCRKLGVWLICDDVYERLSFNLSRTGAPSFLEISDAEDRLIAVNSFSKAWLMTGWRLGWMVAPGTMETDIGKLIEYNTSCAPDFIQAGGLAAIEQGEPHVRRLRSDLVSKRDLIVERLSDLGDVFLPPPGGGMYAFFKIAGFEDSVGLAKQLISEAKLGLAPGAAFGPEGEGWLRWCFAADQGDLNKGIDRLTDWLRKIRS
jgi:aspartate aminotransferase